MYNLYKLFASAAELSKPLPADNQTGGIPDLPATTSHSQPTTVPNSECYIQVTI